MNTERKTLADEREKYRVEARTLLNKAEAEGRDLAPAEQSAFDQLVSKIEEKQGETEAFDARQRAESQLRQSDAWGSQLPPRPGCQPPHTPAISPTSPPGSPYDGRSSYLPRNGRTGGHLTGDVSRTYAAMFGQQTSNDGWQSPNEFFAALHNSQSDPRLVSAMALGEGLGSSGGFSVPSEYAQNWLDSSLEDEIVRPRCAVWPMHSDVLKIPGWEDSDNSSTLYGGFTHQWLGENVAATDSEPKTRQIVLNARKLALFTKASNELVSDGIQLDEQLQAAMVTATGWCLDYYFLNGTGAGQPRGVLTADSRVTVAKESGQTAATIVYQNLVKMFARMAPASVKNSVWLANPTTIPQLLTLTIPIGTSGAHIPAMTQDDGKFFILTREVLFTEKVAAVGTEGDISFIDFTQYACGMRKEVTVEKSIHIGWQNDQTGYRTILRADGMPTWATPHTPKHGNTLSWCVTLADR